MRTARDATLRLESDRFRLRLHCEDCALFDPERDACAHGFPTHEHRAQRTEHDVMFCKDFELA